MKNIIAILLLTVTASLGQSYSLSTNLFFTNNIEAGLTLTYTGTNCLDVSRYQSYGIVAEGSGTNLSTNTITFTFKTSPDGTNYETDPSIFLTGTSYGLTRFVLMTNLSAGNSVAYVKPYQIISSLTNRVTNAWTYGALKMFPRN